MPRGLDGKQTSPMGAIGCLAVKFYPRVLIGYILFRIWKEITLAGYWDRIPSVVEFISYI